MTRRNFFQAVKDKEINLKVYIYTRPHLRDAGLEFELQMGRGVLESMFDKMEVRPDVKTLFLSFPENHLNILEQRVLYARCEVYLPNLKALTIKTHSVYIIQCSPNHCCHIVDDPSTIREAAYENDQTTKLYHPMTGNVVDVSKLNVL
jgi:hypothetical protein